jgi:tetratricopeptide (TPR) repeat protein
MLRVLSVFAIAFALHGAALAQSNDNDSRDKALKLFEDSNTAYKAGKFEDAADLLRQAYDLFPEPILLYNLGRAQEGLGDRQGAIESYERYLAEAEQVDDRAAIERRIATLRAQITQQEADAKKLREARTQERRPVDTRSDFEKYGPWATVGVGGVLVATGIVFGIRSGAKHDDAVAAPGQRDSAELQASAQQYATVANVLFVVGGVAAAGGIGWKVWQRDSTTVQVTPTAVAVRW